MRTDGRGLNLPWAKRDYGGIRKFQSRKEEGRRPGRFAGRMPENAMKIARKVRITNEEGFNLKAATLLFKLAQQFECGVKITDGFRAADAKSLLGLAGLASPEGAELELTADGKDAETALLTIVNLFDQKFGYKR